MFQYKGTLFVLLRTYDVAINGGVDFAIVMRVTEQLTS